MPRRQEDYPNSRLARARSPGTCQKACTALPSAALSWRPAMPSGGATSLALVKMIFFGSLGTARKT